MDPVEVSPKVSPRDPSTYARDDDPERGIPLRKLQGHATGFLDSVVPLRMTGRPRQRGGGTTMATKEPKPDYSPGLAGVIAGETEICWVDPNAGLASRGHD